MQAAKTLFESLQKWKDLQRLVDEATPEGLYLECKTQTGVRLKQGTKAQLAETISAMANSSGGVILLGVATSPIKAHGLDVVSGLEPIGNVNALAARLEVELPMLTVPPVIAMNIRTVKKSKSGSGVAIILVPAVEGDPARSAVDQHFYFRGSDGDAKAPYEVIRRLFSASDVPDIGVHLDERISSRRDDGSFVIPIVLSNDSSAIARDTVVMAEFQNPEACLSIDVPGWTDASDVNPGDKLFILKLTSPIHRGLNEVVGNIVVRMAGDRWPRRLLKIRVKILADRMRGRQFDLKANLKKSGLEMRSMAGPTYLY